MMMWMMDILRYGLRIGTLSLCFAICVIVGVLILCLAVIWDWIGPPLSQPCDSWTSRKKSTPQYLKS